MKFMDRGRSVEKLTSLNPEEMEFGIPHGECTPRFISLETQSTHFSLSPSLLAPWHLVFVNSI
jgi:hypothetical protein